MPLKKFKYRVEAIISKDEKGNLYEYDYKECMQEINTDLNYWGEHTPIKEVKIIKDNGN